MVCLLCLSRMMQDMDNPQVTMCNKGDQHYRSSPSNQSSSSDPGPCGSSSWSQQPGYDGYNHQNNFLSFKIILLGFYFFSFLPRVNAATVSPRHLTQTSQFYKMTAIFQHGMTKSSVHFSSSHIFSGPN